MATVNNYRQGKKCAKCGKAITDGARHGYCRACMVKLSSAERMALGAKPVGRPASDSSALPVPSSLPDAYLVACVNEARDRARRIEAEAASRAESLRRAIAHDPQQIGGSTPVAAAA
jgi:hypothetical protein